MGKRFLTMASMVLLLGVVLAACGSGDDDEAQPTVTRIPNPPNAPVLSGTPGAAGEGTAVAGTDETGSPVAVGASPSAASPVAEEPAAAPAEGASDAVEIVSLDIYFDPSEVTIPADTDVTFQLRNDGAAPHNFSIDELDISIDQAPGEAHEIVINSPAGTYEFYCNVPGHREAGMVGTLTVE
ncbi:MAG: cupredoxin domain-containing protein [Thermomicrobiales bacterium]